MDTVIQTRALTRAFGAHKVVDRVDLAVPPGAIFALLGDNGAGKSTTIRMLTGQLRPDDGSATVLGVDCWAGAVELRHRVGYVPEKPRYYDWMTVDELGGFTAAFHRPGYRDRFLTLTEQFRLGRSSKLKTLSKGGYARLGLALALASDPEVLILDEPTSGLDLFTRREFLNSMVALAAEGRTILISSHAIAELERRASHAAFLFEGRLLLAGSLEELGQRLTKVRVRHDGSIPAGGNLRGVIDTESAGKEWQAVLLDGRAEIAELRTRAGVLAFEELSLSLEEMYTALLARTHGAPSARAPRREPVALAESEDRP